MANLPPSAAPIIQPPPPGLLISRQARSTFKAASPSIYYAVTPQLPRYMSYENLGSNRLNYGDAAMDNVPTSLASKSSFRLPLPSLLTSLIDPQNKRSDLILPLVSQDGEMGVSTKRPVLASCSGSSALLNLPTVRTTF